MAIAAFIPIIGKVLDRVLPDKGAKDAAMLKMLELEQAGNFKDIQADLAQEAERTKRHSADMASDSWLSKNIRPFVLLGLSAIYMLIVVSDSIDTLKFNVPEAHQGTLNSMLLSVYGFYFVSRGIEKVAVIMKKNEPTTS